VESFTPIQPGVVTLYTCGPTVYDYAHIGNLRTYVFEDVLRRVLERAGYLVRHVMNVTDVGHLTDDADTGEDKMEKSAREKARSVWDIAAHYTEAFFRDFGEMSCREPQTVCRATEHIPEMIALIRRLEERGYTYSAGGNLYFDISRFPSYGRLALLDQQDLRAGARIAVDASKRNPHDFALWFTRSKFSHQSMLWDSPWGRGYPGWHIECSAMSMKYLGEQFDIHCGGIDHVPVHHTNEIAQSEAATGKPWVRYWVHGEYLLMGHAKMAKSAGTFVTLTTLKERGYHPLDYRYLLLTAHYRSQLQFSFDALDGAKNARRNLRDRVARLKQQVEDDGGARPDADSAAGPYLERFRDHAENDFDMPQALSQMWGLVKDESVGAAARLGALQEMDAILAVGLWPVESPALVLEDSVLERIRVREEARQLRDFALADLIRRELLDQGIVLEDTAEGVRWRKA
jgi:cysteinyl-tRNA synthetase